MLEDIFWGRRTAEVLLFLGEPHQDVDDDPEDVLAALDVPD